MRFENNSKGALPLRVVGLETEYLVSFIPARRDPPKWLLLSAVEEAIVKNVRVCEAEGGGYFLPNGGAVSFESTFERRDNPVLELATPECSDPLELLLYVRSQEKFLEETARVAEGLLRKHGFAGRLIFGRSNLDWRGQAFGSHENYWISCTDPWPKALGGTVLAAVSGALIFSLNLGFSLLGHTALRLGGLPGRLLRRGKHGRRVSRFFRKGRGYCVKGPFVCRWRLWPRIYSVLLRFVSACLEPLFRLALLPGCLRKDLVPFLLTRQVFAGSGALVFSGGGPSLHLSARASVLKKVFGISMGQRGKAVFDLKPFLRDPFSVLRRSKRLCISGGDSLMCEGSLFLAFGTTCMVLSMLESGERFPELRIGEVVGSWKSVSAGGPFTQILMRNGNMRSALDIQRGYLERAKRFFASRGPASLEKQVIRLWESTLGSLAESPSCLWGQVDWVTKKTLLDGLVFPEGDWKTFLRWGRLFSRMRFVLPPSARLSDLDFDTARSCLGRRGAREFGELLGDKDGFERQRDLYLAAWKLVCRYQEISRGGGYFQKLRDAGDIPSLVDPGEAGAAQFKPPYKTRAAIRAQAIALAGDLKDLQASWETIRVNSLNFAVKIKDPTLYMGGRRADKV